MNDESFKEGWEAEVSDPARDGRRAFSLESPASFCPADAQFDPQGACVVGLLIAPGLRCLLVRWLDGFPLAASDVFTGHGVVLVLYSIPTPVKVTRSLSN